MDGSNYIKVLGLLLLCAGSAHSTETWELPKQKFPVVTASMQPGVMELDVELTYRALRSVAIVGVDEISANWLQLNNDYLVSIGCIGLVVNAPSEEQVEVLRTYTDIPLFAMPVTEHFMEFGGIYPFVIDSTAARVRQ